jgi:hypothetical protein
VVLKLVLAGQYHRCAGATGMHVGGRMCDWHIVPAVPSLISLLPQPAPIVLGAAAGSQDAAARARQAAGGSTELLLLVVFMLGYAAAAEGARAAVIQARPWGWFYFCFLHEMRHVM